MSDQIYDNFRNLLVSAGNDGVHGAVDLGAGGNDIRIILRDEGADALNLADQDLADITAGARIAVGTLTGETVGVAAVGAFDHDNLTLTAVSGASIESIDYYKHTGTESTSPLLFNIDQATGLPVTPNGGDITWNLPAGGVFQIT